MYFSKIISFLTLILLLNSFCVLSEEIKLKKKLPKILISILVRNKAHVLPYFLSYLENLNYPKSRLALWIRSDYNEDNSVEILQTWLNKTHDLYHEIDLKYEEYPIKYINESSQFDWQPERFYHIIELKEEALIKAEKLWADYIFLLDADIFLTNPDTLKKLVSYNLPIVSPMLRSQGKYSNFWCGMSTDYYYHRTDDYQEIYDRKKRGNFNVPMVHSAVLIDVRLEAFNMLTYDRTKLIQNQKDLNFNGRVYTGPLDDIIIFAISANSSDISMYVSNEIEYGFVLIPLEAVNDLEEDNRRIRNIRIMIVTNLGQEVQINKELQRFIVEPERLSLNVDHIYMINLERRADRKRKMELALKELGLKAEYFAAVDGKTLSEDKLLEMNITILPEYADPYHGRKMTMGEIGCFLSHYRIWEKIIELNQEIVLILEDDISFEPYFITNTNNLLSQAKLHAHWDLIYLGRKRLEFEGEPFVAGTTNLVHVGYSYWTLGYLITLEGAKKLINSKPLEKLIPVDEFLPVMFDRCTNDTWNKAYPIRNLIALSSDPLLLYPTHYTGEEGYISDTEDSKMIDESSLKDIHKNDKQIMSETEVFASKLENDQYKAILNDQIFEKDEL